MPKTINVRVMTVDAELEFAIQSNTTGKQLFDQVTKTVGLREIWYFGLQFTDSKGFHAWLKLNRKVNKQDVKKEVPLQFVFRAKFYPENAEEELIQNITRRMFYLQVREGVLSDDIYCSPETAVLLAAYACQVKHGDFDSELHKVGFLSNDRLLPKRVVEQHSLSHQDWEDKIARWYQELKGTMRDDAMIEYLKIAQDLEMYGVNYFDIKNKKGTQLHLGVDALGINVYDSADRLTPRVGFAWSDIRNVSFDHKKFIIKPIDKKSPDFVFYVDNIRINKRILALCMGNHELYIRRRKPDTIEVQQMRAQAIEEREFRRRERSMLLEERIARETAERRRLEMEERLSQMELATHTWEEERLHSMARIEELERRLEEEERRREELEEARMRSEEIRIELEQKTDMEERERAALYAENERIKEMIIIREREIDTSQSEMSKIREELLAARMEREQLEQQARAMEEVALVKEVVMEEETVQQHVELDMVDAKHSRADEERKTLMEQNIRLQEQLHKLSSELKTSRDTTKMKEIDFVHEKNQQLGLDKFKTLREVRKGNTKKRVDEFEMM